MKRDVFDAGLLAVFLLAQTEFRGPLLKIRKPDAAQRVDGLRDAIGVRPWKSACSRMPNWFAPSPLDIRRLVTSGMVSSIRLS